MANINFTNDENEAIELIEDAVIAGKNKQEILDNLEDQYQDITTSRFNYLYSIAKCRVMYKKSDNYKKTNDSFASHNKSKKEIAVELSRQGKSIPQIAKELELEVHTIEYYLDNAKKIRNKAGEIPADKSIIENVKCVHKADNSVKHPNYYNTEHYECWAVWKEIIDTYNIPPVQAALLFNVLKYIWRYSVKGTPLQDLKKAANYIEELIREVQE